MNQAATSAQNNIEDTELPLNIEDLPNYKENNTTQLDLIAPPNASSIQIATNFVKELKDLMTVKRKDQNQIKENLMSLYDFTFNKICETQFKQAPWPQPEEIEQYDQDFEIDFNTQFLYKELCYRHIFARLSNQVSADVRYQSWVNYKEIFNIFINNKDITKENVILPVQWIWDILDEFLYQFQENCKWRIKCKENDEEYFKIVEIGDFWNFQEVNKILTNLIDKSKVLIKGENSFKLDDFSQNTKTIHYFGYFSLIGLLRIYVLVGNYDLAMKIIQPIDFKKLTIYSRAYAGYITLFYYAGFTFLMMGRHQEAVKIFDVLLQFVYKYKQYYQKTFQFEATNKQADRTLFLLAISLVFNPSQIHSQNQNAIKERISDKNEKLQKYDINSFNEVFNYSCPKFINPIDSFEQFKTLGFDKNTQEAVMIQREFLLKQFQSVQNLNNIRGVLKLYTRIPINKAAKVLKTSPNELKEMLDQYKQRAMRKLDDNPFENTIIKRFLTNSKDIDFTIQNDVITVNETFEKLDYCQLFQKYNQKIEQMANDFDEFELQWLMKLR